MQSDPGQGHTDTLLATEQAPQYAGRLFPGSSIYKEKTGKTAVADGRNSDVYSRKEMGSTLA
jgi:hypothetical protein